MRTPNRWIDYEQQMNTVTEFIYNNLDDQLDLNRLAEIAHVSPYHWHRLYTAMRGETAAATVKRLRLHRAAGYLANTTLPVKEIADKSGYSSLQTFTRSFSKTYGMPPATYREQGNHAKFKVAMQRNSTDSYNVTVQELPELETVSLDHQGSYMGIGQAFDQLFGALAAQNLLQPKLRMLAVFYDDPTAVAEADLRSSACIRFENPVEAKAPVQNTTIAGGRYAVLRHQGPYATMQAAYQWLFGSWLVESGHQLADRPTVEEYLNSPQDTDPADLLTDIYLPLAD